MGQPNLRLASSSNVSHPEGGKLKVINLFAGPGAGKSTLAAGLFNLMKRERFECELVTEVAKDLTYEKAFSRLENQTLILAEQEHRLRRLMGKVEYVITDSPFPLGLIYATKPWSVWAEDLIYGLWSEYDNYSFRLHRTHREFQAYGRNQTLEEAIKLDAPIHDLAVEFGAGEFPMLNGDSTTAEYELLDMVLDAQGLKPLSAKYADFIPRLGETGQ